MQSLKGQKSDPVTQGTTEKNSVKHMVIDESAEISWIPEIWCSSHTCHSFKEVFMYVPRQ